MTTSYRSSLPLRKADDPDPKIGGPLEATQKAIGMVPNMYRAMVNLPALLETYQLGYQRLREESGFSPAEQEVLFLAISRENECTYCVAAHSFIADTMSKVPAEVTEAIRQDRPAPDQKLEALRLFAQKMVTSRGNPAAEDSQAFLAAGYSEEQILAVVLAVGVKVLSNYTNHLFATELDPPFAGRSWSPRDARDAP